ncbi:tetratricopeptide repeat protein, partial [Anaplasma marginale]|uniref:tetratricopeptide repeat protein n=1 Tax=Anaplasma marginale TaxID=770 RepID=UPI0005B3D968
EKATAKLLEVNGQLQFSQGEFERALSNWQAAAQKYQTLEDDDNYLKNLINKVRALQNLGLYSRAIKIVTKIEENLDEKPNNIFKHQTLLTIGSLLQGKGRLQESEAILQRSLTVANELNSPDASARSFINLGNTSRLQGQLVEALNLYQLAIEATANTQIELEAKLNQLNLLVATEQIEEATTLIPQIEADLNQLPCDR